MKKIITIAIISTALFSFLLFGKNLPAVFKNTWHKTKTIKSPESNSTVTNVKTSGSTVFKASHHLGIIGVSSENPVDNPSDNLFHVEIDRELLPNEQLMLEFELFGLKDYSSIPFSINNGLAQGGYLVKEENNWNHQAVQVAASELTKGDNIIRFSLPENARFSYKVKNIVITSIPQTTANDGAKLILNSNSGGYYYNNQAYFRGYVDGVKNTGDLKILVDGVEIPVRNGKFEHIAQRKADDSRESWDIAVEALFADGTKLKKVLNFDKALKYNYYFEMPKQVFETKLYALKPEAFAISLNGAILEGEAGALADNTVLSVTALRVADMPALAPDMINVTANYSGYRFLPHGTQFNKPVDLSMAYDTGKIPQGYTEKDIRTYYFDEKTNNWVALPLDTTDVLNHTVKSTTTHFTDMINAIIQVPESPETMGYAPTTMSGIKAANPMAGIVQIDPPGANPYGSANLSFPIKIPAGRRGMQPSLGISYNSGGGNGWLGLGWDLSVPSIGIETRWGVPHYNENLESETYTMGGEQLYPVAHRAEWVPREIDKKFHPRVEGSFAKIIRNGDKPWSYWWEVTDKSGTKYYYGGDGENVVESAVLRDYDVDEAKGKLGNIAHWALTKVVDLHGNSVTYEYDVVNTGDATYPLRQIYLKKITYTGFGTDKGAYGVEFERDDLVAGSTRKDKSFDARLAFKRYNSDLLKTIRVKYQDTLIRSYKLKYKEGAFYKTLLDSITEYDSDGNKFYGHGFEYYDDVISNGQYVPYKSDTTWNLGKSNGSSDGVNASFISGKAGYDDNASAISGNKSSSWGAGVAVTVGLNDLSNNKSMTAGGDFSYSESNSEGKLALMDINGDGLPDKVFMKGGKMYYRKGLKPEENGGKRFDNSESAKLIETGRNFHKEESVTIGGGFQANVGRGKLMAFFGTNKGKTKSKTTSYFSDVNGDGLPDIIDNGTVYFNRIDEGEPVFLSESDSTENPIGNNAGVSSEMVQVDPQELEDAIDANPLHDVVRMWSAPIDGNITITGSVKMAENNSQEWIDYKNADGVKAVIQHKSGLVWEQLIAYDNQTPYEINETLTVKKGDRIYFRVQSIEDGAFDQVEWNPVITYDCHHDTLIDANRKPYYQFSSAEDFLLTGPVSIEAPIHGIVRIKSKLTILPTTDDTKVEILKNDVAIKEIDVQWDKGYNDSINYELEVAENDVLTFRVSSESNIDWNGIKWKPWVYYIESKDDDIGEENIWDKDKNPLIQLFAVPQFTIYANTKIITELWTAADTANIVVNPGLSINPGCDISGDMTFSIKKQDSLIFKEKIALIYDSQLNTLTYELPEDINVNVLPGEHVYLEYHTENLPFADFVESTKSAVSHPTSDTDTTTVTDSIVAGLFTVITDDDKIFGHMFRNWGYFAYNGNRERADALIDETKLNLDEFRDENSDKYDNIERYEDNPEGDDDAYDPNTAIFIPLVPDAKTEALIGYDDLVYISKDVMSSSRKGLDDLSSFKSGSGGEGTRAIQKKSESHSDSKSLGLGIQIPIGISASGNYSWSDGSSIIKSEFIDMNGDRYPDIVGSTSIQYSNHLGGLEPEVFPHEQKGGIISTFESKGVSLGGSYVNSDAKQTTVSFGTKGKSFEVGNAKVSGGINGSYAKGENNTTSSWMDVNGDGLTDKLHIDGDNYSVSFNLGYKFSNPEDWGISHVQYERNISTSAGLGVNIGNNSFAAGVGVSRSKSNTKSTLLDVNGDGLVDIVSIKGDSDGKIEGNEIVVRFNTGNGFSEEKKWASMGAFTRSSSTSESANFAFTIAIKFWLIKLCINPSGNGSKGMSRQEVGIRDVDSDGFPDFVSSETDNHLTVKKSRIARTNLLKTVYRPLGATFTLDYQTAGNTYEMPQSQWVLSKVETYDGHENDGVDHMAMSFDYEDGYHDRHERAFYGFATVKTKQINTENKEKVEVYRSTISNYENQNYYKKGLLLSQYLEDKDGKKYTESVNTIKLKKPYPGPNDPEFLDDDYNVDNGIAFPVLTDEQKLFYEGQETAQKTTHSIYGYDDYGNPVSFTDYGEPGTDKDNISSTVTYHYFEGPYIMSMPASVVITDKTGKEYRKRTTVVNATNGNLEQIDQYLANGDPAVVEMEYDEFGNMTKITYPKNHNAERMYYEYQYDSIVHSFVKKISDAFGYSSTASYDFKHGQVLKTTDLNGVDLEYAIDNKGRLTHVLGPNEKAAGGSLSRAEGGSLSGAEGPITIQFDYHPFDDVPWAHTKNYDPAYPENFMETAIFVDGMGRILQTKKDAEVYNPETREDEEKMVVTGKVIYDAFGRATESYLPITENTGFAGTFNPEWDKEVKPTTQTYDVMDRALVVTLPDDSETKTEYGFANDHNGDLQFHVKSTDAKGIATQSFTNIRGQQTSIKAAMDTWTSFVYDPIGQLIEVTDPIGAKTTSEYDMFGRRTLRNHPDAGITEYEYDLAGNMTYMTTANLKPGGQRIAYKYEYNRLVEINYPENKFNDVRYEYGGPGADYYRAGRLVLQEDGTGAQEFKYGIMGEMVEQIRTIVLPGEDIYTFHTQYKYDTWNRITEMTYPDDEVVKYHYNTGGALVGMHGEKAGFIYNYITHYGYDKFGRPLQIAYGNGTESTYEYDPKRQWLTNLTTKTEPGRNILDNVFSYDKVGNILNIKNNSPIPPANLMGGSSDYTYQYDDLYRLKHAEGSWFGTNHEHKFSLDMEYNKAGDILRKNQLHKFKGYDDEEWAPRHQTTHDFAYKYEGKQPHTLSNIYNSVGPNAGGKTYSYDANGNTLGYTDDKNANERKMLWDEENRLHALADNGVVHHYIYDAGGNRTIKAKGDNQLISINGVNTGGKGSADNYTMYVFPHFTVHNFKYTKHFFVGSQRILSKLGQPGTLDDIAVIEKVNGKNHIDWGIKQNNTNEHIQGHIKWVGDDGALMTAGKSGKIPPGILKKYSDLQDDTTNTGGNTDKYERNQYFFHPDHLGNTSFITDASGEVSQHIEYLPFGEIMVDDRPVNDKNPYLYNGKELDEETGLYYYGARYMDPQIGRWHGVDALAEKYFSFSPYNYTLNNPLKYIDPDGRDGEVEVTKDKETDRTNFDISVKIFIFGDGASKEEAKRIQDIINVEWNKGSMENPEYWTYKDEYTEKEYGIRFNVSVELYDKDNPTNVPSIIPDSWNPFSANNYIEVTNGDVRSFVTFGDEGKWSTQDNDLQYSHEFGHLIGLKDHYKDVVTNGKLHGVTESGYEDNIMGSHYGGGWVQQKNIDALGNGLVRKQRKTLGTKFRIDEGKSWW